MTRILGIDFSGARDAGRKIWIAEARNRAGPLAIDRCFPAAELPASGIDPASALAALRAFILAEPSSLIGCDFPFSLPKRLLPKADWRDFALRFADRFPDAEAFHASCHRESAGREIKRRTDREERTPFNSYNLRLYRQTWWGIAGLLAPLLERDALCVRPQMRLRRDRVIAIEVCAASSLIRIDCYPAYKGRGPARREARAAILQRLLEDGHLAPLQPALARRVLTDAGGDALDAIIGALAARAADWESARSGDYRREGRVYSRLSP